jgi:hypothetical protein
MTQRSQPLRHILRTPAWKWGLMLEAAFWLTVARAALVLVPFPRIGRYLGKLQKPSAQVIDVHDEVAARVRRIGGSVNAVANRFPAEMVCLPRALAAWQMLHRRGILSRLHFGTPLTPDPRGTRRLQTHAWLTSSGVRVTGFPVADECVELGYFARTPEPRQHEALPEPGRLS